MTPGHTHIGSWLYYFRGWSLHELVLRFGYDNYHRLLESTGHSPELSDSTEHSSKTCHPKSLFSTLTGNQSNSIPGDNMDKIMVLVYYPNPDHDVAGLSDSTPKYLSILHYRLPRNHQSRF
jgi:hypothetical protein